MNPKRIAVKFFVKPGPGADGEGQVDLEPFIPMFHRFIQKSSVEGLLLDVANYAHVPNGPGVVLIGHDVDYGIDSTGGHLGLLTLRKRAGDLPLAGLLRDTLGKALGAIREIEADGSGKISFATGKFEIDIVDRLAAANEPGALAQVQGEALPVLKALYGGAEVEVTRVENDPRAPLRLDVRASEVADVATLLERLEIGQATPAASQAKPAVPGPAVPGQTDWDVSAEQLKQLRDEGADFVLVDVREQHEVDICELGGVLIPLGTLEQRFTELDKGAHIVVHCHVGGRSGQATKFLRGMGFENAWNLQGGIRAWIQRIDSSLKDY